MPFSIFDKINNENKKITEERKVHHRRPRKKTQKGRVLSAW